MEQQKLDKAFRASELIVAYLEGELSDEEQMELDSWVEESDENQELFSELTNPSLLNKELQKLDVFNKQRDAALRRIKRKMAVRNIKAFGFIPFIALRYMAAAAFLGIVITGIYLSTRNGVPTQSAGQSVQKQQQDIAPGDGNHIILTLADGRKIVLDSSGAGVLAQQNGAQIIKQKDGQVIYQPKDGPGEAAINSIATPKGRQHELVLPDGSRVWLNALSRIDFPTAFTGTERNVSLSGEAYFDVAKDKSKPFHVNVDGLDVRVTGTRFNINSYKDEAVVKSTLFEGGVKVTKDEVIIEMTPGQQLQMDPKKPNQFKLVKNADLEATAAWKDGVFYLNNIDVPTLMRQAARWYDIEVEYPNGVPGVTLIGEIDRNTNLSELIRVLNESGIKTRLDGKTLQIFQ